MPESQPGDRGPTRPAGITLRDFTGTPRGWLRLEGARSTPQSQKFAFKTQARVSLQHRLLEGRAPARAVAHRFPRAFARR